MTRRQRYLHQALQNIEDIAQENQERQRIYGGLCHAFPVMVRTNGLCQTLAFIEGKAELAAVDPTSRAAAYWCLRRHIATTLDVDPDDLLRNVQRAQLTTYMRYTRMLLEAWVYYKRFAVSVLGVEASAVDDAA